MLDIIANNNWERPIYFSGGSFNNDDFIWMKDYLQLNGLIYKLVPLKQSSQSGHPIDLGSIDADRMYDNVKSWYWGNMGSDKIYHDPQTRRNALSYRINLARLMEQLLVEEKYEKAKDVINIAMENMPLEYYGYYQLLQPFVEGYYVVDEKEKARDLTKQIGNKHKQQLMYYAGLNLEDQVYYMNDIVEQIEIWRQLIEITQENDPTLYASLKEEFNNVNSYFPKFNRPKLD